MGLARLKCIPLKVWYIIGFWKSIFSPSGYWKNVLYNQPDKNVIILAYENFLTTMKNRWGVVGFLCTFRVLILIAAIRISRGLCCLSVWCFQLWRYSSLSLSSVFSKMWAPTFFFISVSLNSCYFFKILSSRCLKGMLYHLVKTNNSSKIIVVMLSWGVCTSSLKTLFTAFCKSEYCSMSGRKA